MESKKITRKSIISIVAGVALLIGAVGLVIEMAHSNQQKRGPTIVGVLSAIGIVYIAKGLGWLKDRNVVGSDEMSKKVGYTAHAASLQVLVIILGLVIISNSFSQFLNKISPEQLIAYILWLIIFLIIIFQAWYARNPERTKL